MTFKTRLLNIAICFDQLMFCLVTLGESFPGETASSAAYRLEKMGKWQGKIFRPMIDWLMWAIFKDGPSHCRQAYENEKQHLRQPEEER